MSRKFVLLRRELSCVLSSFVIRWHLDVIFAMKYEKSPMKNAHMVILIDDCTTVIVSSLVVILYPNITKLTHIIVSTHTIPFESTPHILIRPALKTWSRSVSESQSASSISGV